MGNILATGQLGSSSATLQTGGGAVSIRLFNTHTSAIACTLTLIHSSGTAVTILGALSVDASGSVEITGLPLGPADVISGYAGTGSKVDYMISSCPDSAPLGVRVFDANGSIKSGGSSLSITDLVTSGRISTKDSVASGDSRTVGGMATCGISTTDTITAAASNNSFVSFATTYAIPANTIKAGTVIRVRGMVDISNAAAGTATLTINLRLGGTSILATTAVDQAGNDWQSFDFTFVGRAAPGAAAAVVGVGRWTTSTGGTNVTAEAILQSTTFATNGALTLDSQAKWSAADATTTARLQLFIVDIVG